MLVINRVGQMLEILHKSLDVRLIRKILDQLLIRTFLHIVGHHHVTAGANRHKAKPAEIAAMVFNDKKSLIFASTESKRGSEGGKDPFFGDQRAPKILTANLHALFNKTTVGFIVVHHNKYLLLISCSDSNAFEAS